MFDYSFKPDKKNIMVGFYNDSGLEYYDQISNDISLTAEKYGVQLIENLSDFHPFKDCLLKHAIVLTKNLSPVEASKQYEHLLSWYNTMSLAIYYSNYEEMLSYSSTIDELKVKYKGRINYLRPDIFIKKTWVGSHQKILDNLICDTIRVKYNPINDTTFQINLDTPIKNFFQDISRIYADYKLYHRSPTDGFISVRHGTGFYITATKTDKSTLDLGRISYVHHYDEASNTLFYSGNYLPSSDVVEAAMVYRDNPSLNALIHTHASDLYTRNPDFKSKIKVGRGSYGIPELGRQINQIIKEYYNDFIILEEHGEVFALTSDILESGTVMENILRASQVKAQRKSTSLGEDLEISLV